MKHKTFLDGIILKIDNQYPLLQEEYKELLNELPVLKKKEYTGEWLNKGIKFPGVDFVVYIVGNDEKGYFQFQHVRSEWVVNKYCDIRRVQKKTEQVTRTEVWYE